MPLLEWPACPALIQPDCSERRHAEAAGIHGIVLMLESVVGAAPEAAVADSGLKKLCGKNLARRNRGALRSQKSSCDPFLQSLSALARHIHARN
jgi:hypothetical protein